MYILIFTPRECFLNKWSQQTTPDQWSHPHAIRLWHSFIRYWTPSTCQTQLDIKRAMLKRPYPPEMYILWGRLRTDVNQIIQKQSHDSCLSPLWDLVTNNPAHGRHCDSKTVLAPLCSLVSPTDYVKRFMEIKTLSEDSNAAPEILVSFSNFWQRGRKRIPKLQSLKPAVMRGCTPTRAPDGTESPHSPPAHLLPHPSTVLTMLQVRALPSGRAAPVQGASGPQQKTTLPGTKNLTDPHYRFSCRKEKKKWEGPEIRDRKWNWELAR